MPRKAQTSSASGWLAVPQKILNLSSTRARCGLRSCLSSGLMPVFFSAVVARVAIKSALGRWLLVVGQNPCRRRYWLRPTTKDRRPTTVFLAGPLGFEPRQSAPKALDLPLVDGPVKRSAWRIALQLSFKSGRSTIENQSRILFQYCWHVNVRVATAFNPCFRRRLPAFAASACVRNSPYRVDPEPESEAYLDPARSSAPFMSRNSGYRGKTTFSKSFSIPVRTRSRRKFPARLPRFAGAPVLGKPLSHAESAQPTSNSLSDAPGLVNSSFPMERRASPPVQIRVGTAAPGCPAERSSAPLTINASQSANACGVETPTSGITTTIGKEGKSARG